MSGCTRRLQCRPSLPSTASATTTRSPSAARLALDDGVNERLVVVHTTLEQSPDELVKGLAEAGLPRLFIPAPVDFHQIDTMPLIGIGKVDLEAINSFARQAAAARQSKRTATR